MGRKLLFLAMALLMVWIGSRFVFAEKNDEPAYKFVAGADFIQKEWNYSTRFDNETDPRKLNTIVIALNYMNRSFFNISRPLFWVENQLSGGKIPKGEPAYAKYMSKVQRISVKDWDYVISSEKDGKNMNVIKNNSIVEKID